MQALSQILAITLVNIRSIPQRLGSSVVAIVGIAGVVVVFVSVLSIAQGFRAAMTTAGDPRTAIVLRSGTDSEMSSGLSREQTQIVKDAPGLTRGADGPIASAELFVIVNHPKRSTGTDANVPLRGVESGAFAVRPRLKLVEGRRFEPGRNEIIVGRAAAGQFAGLAVGNDVRWGENAWKVVGIFEADGAISESELWCDAKVLQGAYRRGDSFQSVYVQLEREDSLESFRTALAGDPRLNVMVERETDYLAAQSTVLQTLIRTVGFVVAALMAIGAVFGAINTMYNAVASRTREIATLRALGFGALSIVTSVMAESAVLALLGGVLGGVLAWVLFDGYRTSTMNFQSFSQVAFAFRVTPTLLVQGLVCALVMGLIGGILPAIRAARLPIVNALREL
ncbi:Macrolide export ATP-binding/permease protein MacB [Luteitalea pratensis]|uniref:Macrolide export ATP-binding/permease protein MacB n=1 Tax=Luteitalea pratensis TaxID=1855912 RepID=A0A143PG33_LUTPR|nr:ABC transporter permease [Luteitalea pratensis]AMY07230.1 Macrolide export ATP-binding/permease protein MacB [Luteitalea pratensis]